MTVSELLAHLQDLSDDGLDECEVRLAFQPSWPLAIRIRDVVVRTAADDEYDEDYEELPPPGFTDVEPTPENTVVWILDGGHPDDSPYAPEGIFDGGRWQ